MAHPLVDDRYIHARQARWRSGLWMNEPGTWFELVAASLTWIVFGVLLVVGMIWII